MATGGIHPQRPNFLGKSDGRSGLGWMPNRAGTDFGSGPSGAGGKADGQLDLPAVAIDWRTSPIQELASKAEDTLASMRSAREDI